MLDTQVSPQANEGESPEMEFCYLDFFKCVIFKVRSKCDNQLGLETVALVQSPGVT